MDRPTKSVRRLKGGRADVDNLRLRFASSSSRSKRASADVYRASDRGDAASRSSAAAREGRVHDAGPRKQKRRRKGTKGDDEEGEIRYLARDGDAEGLGIGRTAVIVSSKSKHRLETSPQDVVVEEEDEPEEEGGDSLVSGGTLFLGELEVAAQRNGSRVFQRLVRELRPLCKSLAELLHHRERVVDLLCAHLLSPRGDDHNPTPVRRTDETLKSYRKRLAEEAPDGYVVNVATDDVLHLLGVLARELRGEIYPLLHSRILPRVVDDLLNSPATAEGHNVNVLDVSHVEAAFRCVSYLFKYTSGLLVYGDEKKGKDEKKQKRSSAGDADVLRQYYGKTICHGREVVRRLASEAYAPALRKCPDAGLKRHLARTVRALAGSLAAAAVTTDEDDEDVSAKERAKEENAKEESEGAFDRETSRLTHAARRAREDAIEGVSSLFFEVARGAPGRIHARGRLVVRAILDVLIGFSDEKKKKKEDEKKQKNEKKKGNDRAKAPGEPVDHSLERSKARAAYEVASQFLYKLRGHVARRGGPSQGEGEDVVGRAFADVMDEMHRALDLACSKVKEPASSIAQDVAGHFSDLLKETIGFQDGRLLKDGAGGVDRVAGSLQSLLGRDVYRKASRSLRDRILRCLCAAWRANPTHPSFARRLGSCFPAVVAPTPPDANGSSAEAEEGGGALDAALFLARNLLTHLPRGVASQHLVPALLGAAAESASSGTKCVNEAPLILLHAVATAVWPGEDSISTHDFDIDDAAMNAFFTREAAEHCPVIPSKLRKSLFNLCLNDNLEALSTKKKAPSSPSLLLVEKELARLGYMSRCIPFLVCIECSSGNDDENSGSEDDVTDNCHSEESLNRVFKWFTSMLKLLDAKVKDQGERGGDGSAHIAMSLFLESCSISVMECHNRLSSSRMNALVKNTLTKAISYANSLLFLHPKLETENAAARDEVDALKREKYEGIRCSKNPKNFWVVRGVAAVVHALSNIDPSLKLNDRSNDTFDLLVPNLSSVHHFLRLNTLCILESYPALPFVTDHADLDLTDDLEEEHDHQPRPMKNDGGASIADGSPGSSLSGKCDVISLLRILESIPIALPNERKLTTQLSRVEVYARTGKLPIAYAEAVVCHMLGIMRVKFAPVWPAAVKVIVALSSAQEGPVWPYLESALKQSMKRTPSGHVQSHPGATSNGNESYQAGEIMRHHEMCIACETTGGRQINLLGYQDKERNGQVSRHAVADEVTSFESVWSILVNAPHLTATRSKVIVPIFLEFLVAQYYVFHEDDPDSREIDFVDLVESHTKWPKEVLGRKVMQKKLECFLKVFAAVKGPQQLFKHKILLQIFVSFLANPDAKLSNLAFACVLRFKLPYLSPYVDHVQPMLKREGLRDALTKFDLSSDSEVVAVEHRNKMLPIVTRILFGRFSARGNGAKSSKDSPAARRAAILSFFSGIGNSSGELDYFVYMMVRPFIPRDVNIDREVQCGKGSLATLVAASQRISLEELRNVPIKRQEGFLNLLSDVIKQVGFGLVQFVPIFVDLLLVLCEQSEEALVASIKNQSSRKNAAENASDKGLAATDHDGNSRIGRIRNLTFLRLAEIFTKFAPTVEFSQYGERLWKSMSSSLTALPNTVINAENPPSILQLIESLSLHHRLIPLLRQSDNVGASLFKCIAGTTRMHVMNCVLRIIDSLLTHGGAGKLLILEQIHLLIAQFTNRLTKDQKMVILDEDLISRSYSNKVPKQHPMEGFQLNILCRVSELVVSSGGANVEHVATMERLCDLLVPLLKFVSHPNQLYLIRTVNSLLPNLSSESVMSHFHTLSKLLGPNKNHAGIASNEHRQTVSSAISAICNRVEGCTKLRLVGKAVMDVNAMSTSHVDEHDFATILPVLNGLGATNDAKGSWLDLSMMSDIEELENTSKQSKAIAGTRVLLPLIYSCFNMIYDADGVISRASVKALKSLISTSSEQTEQNRASWVKLIETTFVPCLKSGIMTKDISTRRSFVQLISHLARHFSGSDSVHLYGDLKFLIRDDDQELDFFLNVTHVQLHRRVKAMARLRKLLSDHEGSADQSTPFSAQSLANILLPLAMHPVYEYKSKTEEAYTVEAILAVGEISKHLPWSKYNSSLQSVLQNLGRYPDQERFLIALTCAMIDSFHFAVETGGTDNSSRGGQLLQSSEGNGGNGVWRSLKNRIIPKVESFLIKEKIDKHGSKVQSLRSSVVLALMKLFQKLPLDTFETQLPKLITVVCSALKNKNVDERRIARDTLSKMAASLELKYLPLILSELSVSLSEGYKLHVRSAALHSILTAITKVYQPPSTQSANGVVTLPFDRCVPAMLDLIHQDIFGKASEIKEVNHVEKRLVKEALGQKSQDSLEIISRCIHFRPSIVTTHIKESLPGLDHASAVHALVTPFLDRLRDPDVPSSTVKKVKECLIKVAVGFSNNPSARYDEVLPFVYATVAPFVRSKTKSFVDDDADLENSDDEVVDAPIQVSRSNGSNKPAKKADKVEKHVVAVATWNPSSLGTAENQRSALKMKTKQTKALHKVRDGVAAPKLTGSSRHTPMKSSQAKSLNSPANACAVGFGLNLLNSSLKRSKLDVSDQKLCSMADPYLGLLTYCVCSSSDNQAVILSLRCLGVLLRMDLPSVPASAKDLGPGILNHLTSTGAASNIQSDIVQGCFKTLTLLISHPKFSSSSKKSTETMPLSDDQMQALLSMLHSAVREYDHHNATFGLVKAISSKRYMSAEFYDLMDIILKLSVQSHKPTIRLQSSQIFLQYLVDYPMGEARMDGHLHQIILNIKYEYEEGRLSAIDLLSSLIQKFHVPIIEGHAQLFFLPMVLQLANDESRKCKESVAHCIALLFQRISTDLLQVLFGYAKRWSKSSGDEGFPMRKAGAQIIGLVVDARPDFVKRNASDIFSAAEDVLTQKVTPGDDREWELLYHNLVCIEKMDKQKLTSPTPIVFCALVDLLAYPHPWIMQVSSRIMNGHLSSIDPETLSQNGSKSFVAKYLYKIARNLCAQLDLDETHFVETTSKLAIKAMAWVFRAMKHNPNICYNDDEDQSKDPCLWLMTRLSNIAKPTGSHRRESVFKCFAALCTCCSPEDLVPYLELMIDPIDRAIREATNKSTSQDDTQEDPHVALTKDVLQVIEDKCGTEHFIQSYAEVNRKVREKRSQRKQEIASEAVHDPAAAAKRKMRKQFREKSRRKRRVEDRRAMRGAAKKRRSA